MSHPVLNLIRHTGFDTAKLQGDAKVKVKLSLPLIKDVPKDRVIVDASARISNMGLKDALPGIDITNGDIELSVDEGALKATGKAKLEGIPAKLTWQRAAGAAAKQSAVIEANLDGEERKKIGIDLGTFLRGPVGIKATIDDLGDPEGRVDITADLDEADMRITADQLGPPGNRQDQGQPDLLQQGQGRPPCRGSGNQGTGPVDQGRRSVSAPRAPASARRNSTRCG